MVNYYSQPNKSFNRSLSGGSSNDTYYFINDWGTYIILSSSGLNELNLTAVLVPLTINLTSSTGHEVIDSLGNTINWTNNTIRNVYAGSASDLIYGNTANNLLSGGQAMIQFSAGPETTLYWAGLAMTFWIAVLAMTPIFLQTFGALTFLTMLAGSIHLILELSQAI